MAQHRNNENGEEEIMKEKYNNNRKERNEKWK